MSDPSVSPADTIFGVNPSGKRAVDELREFAAELPDDIGPCFGRDVVTMIDALLAVGERDKAERAQFLAAALDYKAQLAEALSAGERDRRQIARLTEVGKAALIVADLNGERRSTYGRVVTNQEWTTALCNLEMVAIASRAVLADEEDA